MSPVQEPLFAQTTPAAAGARAIASILATVKKTKPSPAKFPKGDAFMLTNGKVIDTIKMQPSISVRMRYGLAPYMVNRIKPHT